MPTTWSNPLVGMPAVGRSGVSVSATGVLRRWLRPGAALVGPRVARVPAGAARREHDQGVQEGLKGHDVRVLGRVTLSRPQAIAVLGTLEAAWLALGATDALTLLLELEESIAILTARLFPDL